jgi:hypothetical protein
VPHGLEETFAQWKAAGRETIRALHRVRFCDEKTTRENFERTIRRSVSSAVLLAPDLDHHLLESGHDGSGTEVPKVRHSVPRRKT